MAVRTAEIFDRQMPPVTLKVGFESRWISRHTHPSPRIGEHSSLAGSPDWQRRRIGLASTSPIWSIIRQWCKQCPCCWTERTSHSNSLASCAYRFDMFPPLEKPLVSSTCPSMVHLPTMVPGSELSSLHVSECPRNVARRNVRCQNDWTRASMGQSTITHECLEGFSSYSRLDGESWNILSTSRDISWYCQEEQLASDACSFRRVLACGATAR